MEEREIFACLCIRDKRNPIHREAFDDKSSIPTTHCKCYNCLYGRDKLARTIVHERLVAKAMEMCYEEHIKELEEIISIV